MPLSARWAAMWPMTLMGRRFAFELRSTGPDPLISSAAGARREPVAFSVPSSARSLEGMEMIDSDTVVVLCFGRVLSELRMISLLGIIAITRAARR